MLAEDAADALAAARSTVRSLRGAACLAVVLASLVTGCGTAPPRVVDTRTARDLNRDSHDLSGALPGQLIPAGPGTDRRTTCTASTGLIATTATTATDVIAAQPITGHGPARALDRRTGQPAPG